ncbi:hypothetical protein [Aeromicrobium sp. LTX1]
MFWTRTWFSSSETLIDVTRRSTWPRRVVGPVGSRTDHHCHFRGALMFDPIIAMEWGPAHLRDDADFDEAPEDN